MGGVVRISVPELTSDGRHALLRHAAAARDAVSRVDAIAHLNATLEVYEVLLQNCSNRVLVNIAHTTLMPVVFGYRASLPDRTPDWALLADGWERFQEGITTSDNVLAELALEEIHRLPLTGLTQAVAR
ncbi:hypothetical protein GCM10009588_04030 [Microbacterium phyllosphaerae]